MLERKDAAAVLVGDQAAQRIAAAWPNVPKSIDERSRTLFVDATSRIEPATVVRYYWQHVEFDLEDIVRLSGVSSRALCDQKLELLRGQFLVFPDGTLAIAVKRLLEDVVDLGRFDKATASVRLDDRIVEE